MSRVVSEARSRQTGTVVQVVDNRDGLFDQDDPNPWFTLCVDHGGVCSHETKTLAMQFRPVPNEWCPTCQISEAVDEQDEDATWSVGIYTNDELEAMSPGEYAEARAKTEAAIEAKVAEITARQEPRCGTCGSVCDPFRSDEGYSHCCNDRIEYPDEWLQEPDTIREWAAEAIRWTVR